MSSKWNGLHLFISSRSKILGKDLRLSTWCVELTHEELRPFSTLCIWKISNWGITIELLGRLNFFCIQVQRSQIWFYSGKLATTKYLKSLWNVVEWKCAVYLEKMGLRLRLVNEFQELIHVYVKIRELSSPFHTVSLSRKEIQWNPPVGIPNHNFPVL